MIFPYDVNKVVVDSNKIAGENKIQAAIVAFVIGGFVSFLALSYLLNTILGLGLGVTIFVFVLVAILAGVFVFRFVIFDEDLKKKEYESGESDSFARYMWLRANASAEVPVGGSKATAFEYVDGSCMCVLELRFGSNDDLKSANTELLNERMMSIASDNGLESRIIIMPENFKNSAEFRQHTKAMNSIRDKEVAKSVMLIDDAIMEKSIRECNVDIVYFMLRAVNGYQRSDLELSLKKILSLIEQNISAYRSVQFLNADDLMNFFREFYKIAAIDLSMMRTIELAQQISEDFEKVVSILSITTKTNKVFTAETDWSFNNRVKKVN